MKILVKANAKENSIKFDENLNVYRVSVRAKPENGKANLEIIKFLSKHYKKKVKIKSGFKSKRKTIEFL
jgi:uncharacterized protein (TIGR00251 family)|tara:strand:+ start:410 stop:616 length:207 start_codon:yes stop_codon:yes gene_type:complete